MKPLIYLLLLLFIGACSSTRDPMEGSWLLQYKAYDLGGTIDSKWGAGTIVMTFEDGLFWQTALTNQATNVSDTLNYVQDGNFIAITSDSNSWREEIVEINHRRLILARLRDDGSKIYEVWEPLRVKPMDQNLDELVELLMSNSWVEKKQEQEFEFWEGGQLIANTPLNFNLDGDWWWVIEHEGAWFLGLYDPNVLPTIVQLKSISDQQVSGTLYNYDRRSNFSLEKQSRTAMQTELLLGKWEVSVSDSALTELAFVNQEVVTREVEEHFEFLSDQLIYTRGEQQDTLSYSTSNLGNWIVFEEWRSYWKGKHWQIIELDESGLSIVRMNRVPSLFETSYTRDTTNLVR